MLEAGSGGGERRRRRIKRLTSQRPSARDLLKHRFIKAAKKPSYLTELIERHERWQAEGGVRAEYGYDHDEDFECAALLSGTRPLTRPATMPRRTL